jgi:hypothetical protein
MTAYEHKTVRPYTGPRRCAAVLAAGFYFVTGNTQQKSLMQRPLLLHREAVEVGILGAEVAQEVSGVERLAGDGLAQLIAGRQQRSLPVHLLSQPCLYYSPKTHKRKPKQRGEGGEGKGNALMAPNWP